MNSTVKSEIRGVEFKNNYPKVEYSTDEIIKDTNIMKNLIISDRAAGHKFME
jgi:hypothetical protein